MSQNHQGLLPNQVRQVQNVVLILIIVITFWLGFTSSSFLLIAQAVLATNFFIQKYLDSKGNIFTPNFWDLFWLVVTSGLIAVFASLNLVELQTPLAKSVPGAIILIAFCSLIAQIILIVGVEKKPLKLEFFRDNSSWLFTIVAGLTLQFSNWSVVDPLSAVILLGYLLVTILLRLYKKEGLDTKQVGTQDTVYQLDSEVIDELLQITKLEKLDNFNVIEIEDDYLVTGNLIVSNNCNQEDVFEIKTKSKKILKKSGLKNSILEIVYLAEFKKGN